MKGKFNLLLAALMMLAFNVTSWGQTRTVASIDFSEQGYANAQSLDGTVIAIDENASIVFNKATGGTAPSYYNSGTSIRAYKQNTIVISVASGNITSFTITPGTGEGTNPVTADVGTLDYPSWTGSSNAVTLTIGGTSGHRRVKAIEVTYEVDANQVSAPVFTPAGGAVYASSVTVTASSTTTGATIRYTTNGDDPTTSSPVFPATGVTLTQTTTIKAKAYKSGMTESSVTSATYTFPTMYANIAAWRADHTATNSTVSGISGDLTAVFQSGSYLYVQDATGSLLIYGSLDNDYDNGDVISGGIFGTSSLYNGLIEFMPTQQPAAGIPGTPVEPTVVTAAQIANDFASYESKFVKLEGVTFSETHTFSIGNSVGRTAPFTQGGISMNCFDNYKVLDGFQVTEGEVADIIGLVGCYGETKQIFPRSTEDIIPQGTPQLVVATPTFTPDEGEYVNTVTVSISCTTEGASIYYTTDGTTPTASSTLYTQPIVLNATTTLNAIAMKADYENSAVATATYTIIVLTPTTFNKVVNAVDITTQDAYLLVCEAGSTAGTALIASNALQTVGITLSPTDASIYTATGVSGYPYTVSLETAEGGYYVKMDNRYLNNASSTGLSLGENPSSIWAINPYNGGYILQNTSNNNRFIGGVTAEGLTYKAYAINNLGNDTYPVVVLYKEGSATPMEQVATPTISPESALYTTPQQVSISCTTEGASIYYTLDGSTPTTESLAYTEPFTVDVSTTVKAIAVKLGMLNSEIATANYTIAGSIAAPTFSPEGGSFLSPQQVTISCATEDVTLHYTTDGSDPTASSTVYTGPITVSTSMTIKAMATKVNCVNSNIATATFEIHTPITIAEARQLENNAYAAVEGIVTHIDGRNVYVQDATAAIVLYLNANTVPTDLSLGYQVRSYGKKSVYNGLVELTGINGSNENEFIVLSTTGNALPLAVKTIAEVLADYNGSNLLQSTRIQIVNAVIGAINNNGNTPIMQGESQINIYKLPVVEGLLEGDFVTVTGVVGCHNAAQLLVYAASDVEFTHRPFISVNPSSLSGFTYVEGNGPSAEQSFVVSGQNLQGNITVTPPTDYQISLGSGSAFTPSNSLVLNAVAGSVAETTIYVRLKANLPLGQYVGEQITLTSSSADDAHVTCSGNVHEPSGPGSEWHRISYLDEIAEGNRIIIAARHDNENANSYYAMTAATTGKPEGVLFTSVMEGGDEVLAPEIIAAASTFAWTVTRIGSDYMLTNEQGQVLGYNSSTNFATGGNNTAWSITQGTSIDTGVMVSNYTAFNIINVNVNTRAAALNSNHNFGPYSTSNMTNGNGANYNFYLDIFLSTSTVTPMVAAPSFSPDGGTYYEPQEVTLTCPTEGASIYYSTVSENGPWTAYSTPIAVAEDMTIWAYGQKEGYDNSAVVSAEYIIRTDMVIIFSQDWEGDWNGWTTVTQLGEPQWTINSYNGNHYAYANAYNQGATEDWLISPSFNLNAYSDVNLSFRNAKNYNGPDVELYFSGDNGQNWQPIVFELSPGSWTWVDNTIPMSSFSGTECVIAFKYCSTGDAAAGWEIDDIVLYSGNTTLPYLNVTPSSLNGFSHLVGEGPSEPQTFVISGGNLPANPGSSIGTVLLEVTGNTAFEISLDGVTYNTNAGINVVGTLEPTTVYVRLNGQEIGQYNATVAIEDGGTTANVSLSGEVLSNLQPYIEAFMPLYIQGNNGSNNNRVPVATAVYIVDLEPNTTYRYVNQFVDINDGPETAGAGNVIYASPSGFYRSTSPSLATEGGYGEFTTDEDGTGFAWFINEPTANTRFTPGNQVFLRIRINDGHDGTNVSHIFTTEESATVLNFGTESNANQGTAFYVKSNEDPMTFAMMFDNDYAERPLYSTPIETTGIDYTAISQYAGFYQDEVSGKDGYFGGIIPNDNGNGIYAIWILDLESFVINDYYAEDGAWDINATVNPHSGLDSPLFIDLTDTGIDETAVMDIKVWNVGQELRIENGETESLNMTVYNVLGQPVMHKTVAGESTVRFQHNLTEGIYVVTLQSGDRSMSAKIIVR